MRRGLRPLVLLAWLPAAGFAVSCSAVVRWKVGHLVRDNPQVLYQIDTQAKAVALTIDDGPDAATTPELLPVLERHGSVIILHDWGSKGRRTVKTLSNVLPVLVKRGFRVVTLTELESLK